MFIVSSTKFEGEYPTDMGYLETEGIDDVLDAVRVALEKGATQIHISVEEDYVTEGYDNEYN